MEWEGRIKLKEKLQNKSYFKIIIFIVVLLLPIIYSFFYLKSYWDPYGKLEDMDVAIVNLDENCSYILENFLNYQSELL